MPLALFHAASRRRLQPPTDEEPRSVADDGLEEPHLVDPFTEHRHHDLRRLRKGKERMRGEGQIVFGQGSTVVIDPSEDRLRTEFAGVKRFYVPLHSVIRIDEVERQGPARITAEKGSGGADKVSPFPLTAPPSGKTPKS